uniref:Superoxide dismutase [Cu-Zn]-like n=1 Tax=Elaeis guineensis var. tenera TaxID=51953 RepID=A0A6I9QER3_ELAGV|nr:superoxide dismutase [Cu-Zn]-like [Elaeis guineensis]
MSPWPPSTSASPQPPPVSSSPRPPPTSLSLHRDPSKVIANISGLKRGLHGFHVYALGDTTNGCMSTGSHFNLAGKEHGAPPEDENSYTGDLGNVIAGEDGIVNFSIVDKQIPLSGPNFIIERAVVVHANPDDLEKDKLYSSDIHINFIFH